MSLNMIGKESGITWPWLVIGLSFIYLMVELAFNVYLVKNTMATDANIISRLELLGRSIAATGCVVAVVRVLSLRFIQSNITAAAISIFTIWLGAFFGQKALIDWYVESSTENQRIDAWYVAMLKQGLKIGAIQLEDFELSTGDLGEENTLLSLIGLVSYSNTHFVTLLREKSKEVIISIADWQAFESTNVLYNDFLELRSSLNHQFTEGLRAQEHIKSVTPAIQRDLQQLFKEQKYCQQQKSPNIESCIEMLNAVYNNRMVQAVGVSVDWKKFCTPQVPTSTFRLQGKLLVTQDNNELSCEEINGHTIENVLLDSLGMNFRFSAWDQFVQIPSIQRMLQEHLNVDHQVDPDVDKNTFYERYLRPKLRSNAIEKEDDFLARGSRGENGFRALRSVIVHPFAMGFSLFFGAINAIGFLTSISRIAFGVGVSYILAASLFIGIFAYPLTINTENIGLLEAHFGNVSFPIKWILIVEPLVFNITGGFG